MKAIKQIPRPDLTSAKRLTPLEMNNLRLFRQHTVLSPELINRLAANTASTDTAKAG